MKEEPITTLTEAEAKYVDDLERGHIDYTSHLTGEYEKKVITYVKHLAMGEWGDNVGLSVFITHGQDLQVWMAKGYEFHPQEKAMTDQFANHIVDRLQVAFGLNFTHRSTGSRSLGFIVDEDQTC
jgi:hypothetical protein